MAAQPLDAAAAALLQELGHADVSGGTRPTPMHCGRLRKCMWLFGPVKPWITAGLLSWRAGHGLNAFWESGKTHVAVLGPFVPWTGWAWLKCVLGGCEKAGGCLGLLEPWVAVGLLPWCTGHGLNAGRL